MSVEKTRRRSHFAGSITIGASADAGLLRAGANVIGPKSGDTIAVSSGTAVIGTANLLLDVAGALVIGVEKAGSPALAFRHSDGTVYALGFAAAGGAVIGTPVT